MQAIFSSWRGRDMEREIFSANVIMLTNGILFLTWDSKVNYWICHIDTLDIHRNFPWSFNNKVLQRAILQGQGCILWVNKAVFCSSFCLFCHFKLYYSPFCDETFQRNLHWGKNMFPQRMGNNLHALFMSKFLWVFKKKIKLIISAVSLILFCFLLCDWLFNIAGVFLSFSDRIRVFLELQRK